MKKPETNEEMIYGFIIDELDHAISPDNKQVLDQWRGSSAANEKVYQEFLNIHLNMDRLFEKKGYDPQSSWEVLDKKLDKAANDHQPAALDWSKARIWLGMAASILLVVSIGYYLSFKAGYETISAGNKATFIVLPDSTRIDLNAFSKIRYRKNDFLKDRKIELLSGEAFINVSNHKFPQFKLIIGELEALDIGTRFNVVKTDKAIRVIVEDGQIALKEPRAGKEVMLTPGKLGRYDLETRSLDALNNLNPNYKAWINKAFIFNEVPLQDVVSQLSEVYNEPIQITDPELKIRKLSAKLQYKTLDSVIAVISASLQCKSVKANGVYKISTE